MYRRDIFSLGGVAALAARGATRSSGHSTSDHLFDVHAFGATGDGKTKDTAAIQKAIDACTQSAANRLPAT